MAKQFITPDNMGDEFDRGTLEAVKYRLRLNHLQRNASNEIEPLLNFVDAAAAYAANDGEFVLGSGRFSVTLPDPAANDKSKVWVFNEGTGVIQPLTAAGTIVGDSRLLAPQALGTYVCDGDNNRWIAQVKERFVRPPLRSAAQGQYYTYDSATFPSEWTQGAGAVAQLVQDGAWRLNFSGFPEGRFEQQLVTPINGAGDTVVYFGPISWRGLIPPGGTSGIGVRIHPDAAGPDAARFVGGFLGYNTGTWKAEGLVLAPAFSISSINIEEYTFQTPIFIALVVRQSGVHTIGFGGTNNFEAMRRIDLTTTLLPAVFGTPWLSIQADSNNDMVMNIGGIDRHDA